MKKTNILTAFIILILGAQIALSDLPKGFMPSIFYAQIDNQFLGGNNLQTPLRSDGIINYDKITFTSGFAGLVWPVQSATMKTIDFASGLWIAGRVLLPGNLQEIRTAVCLYNSIFTPGNVPVPGQVPPHSVCDDASWKVYHVSLIDSTLVNGGVRSVVAGGHSYSIVYDSWASWPIGQGAPYAEVNGTYGYQPGWNADRPGIGIGSVRPSEIIFTVYMDYTNCTDSIHITEIGLPGGTKPLGVEIQQLAYTFNCPGYENSYFVRWKLINKSSNVWESVYIGLANDADIGYAGDDAIGCDSTRNIAFTYNGAATDNTYGSDPPAIGTRLIQGPLIHTGNSGDTVRLPYGTYIGYKMEHMNSMNYNLYIHCNEYPPIPDAAALYQILKGNDQCGYPLINPVTGMVTKFMYSGDACTRTGWYDNLQSDRRTIQSTGPVTFNPGDTQIVVMSFIISRGLTNLQSVCELLNQSDIINNGYYSGLCSSVVGLMPNSNSVPLTYNLFQNYPNPFNPVTKIKFDIAGTGAGNVRLTIYDALGRVVSTLVNEKLRPGTYEINWDGSYLTSGVYFVQLIAGDYSKTNKMVLIK